MSGSGAIRLILPEAITPAAIQQIRARMSARCTGVRDTAAAAGA